MTTACRGDSLLLSVFRLILGILVLLIPSERAGAQELRLLTDLRGTWRFEIGDDTSWARATFDDGRWAEVKVPGRWEDQGFPGYDGYAWYRKTIWIPVEWKGKDLVLKMGRVDDVDEVYVNGRFAAFTGEFPPQFSTAYNFPRQYPLQGEDLKYGAPNLIAVRVYDDRLEGGITGGEVGVFERSSVFPVDQNLRGIWKFAPGDSMSWKSVSLDDRRWLEVQVPAFWETQGFRGYNGYGWYRTVFRPLATLTSQHLVILVGKIDDIDEVYLNGERIGTSGKFPRWGRPEIHHDEYRQLRAYTIPSGLLRDGENTLAVRVYDDYLHGGIYDGPVGIITRERYLAAQRAKKPESRAFWETFRDAIRGMFP